MYNYAFIHKYSHLSNNAFVMQISNQSFHHVSCLLIADCWPKMKQKVYATLVRK